MIEKTAVFARNLLLPTESSCQREQSIKAGLNAMPSAAEVAFTSASGIPQLWQNLCSFSIIHLKSNMFLISFNKRRYLYQIAFRVGNIACALSPRLCRRGEYRSQLAHPALFVQCQSCRYRYTVRGQRHKTHCSQHAYRQGNQSLVVRQPTILPSHWPPVPLPQMPT